VDIDEKECAKHPFRATHLRHYVGTLTQIRPDDATSYYSK
jgi:galactonate dehydratase